MYPQYAGDVQTQDSQLVDTSGGPFTIGYTGTIDGTMQLDFDTACSELENVTCVHGESVSALVGEGVDAIINASNRWDVYGSGPAVHEAVEAGIPVFMLNAESGEANGVFNLSVEKEVATTSLTWMLKSMNDKGEIALYNFGDSELMRNIIEGELKGRPDITPYSFTPSYEGSNPFYDGTVKAMFAEHPNLGAIWSSEPQQDLFWIVKDDALKNKPYFECLAREDMLINWKQAFDSGSTLQCIAFIRPGGLAYEGVYTAFYYLNGYKFRSDAFVEGSNHTLRYDLITITNDTIPLWVGTSDLATMRGGKENPYTLSPMTRKRSKISGLSKK